MRTMALNGLIIIGNFDQVDQEQELVNLIKDFNSEPNIQILKYIAEQLHLIIKIIDLKYNKEEIINPINKN